VIEETIEQIMAFARDLDNELAKSHRQVESQKRAIKVLERANARMLKNNEELRRELNSTPVKQADPELEKLLEEEEEIARQTRGPLTDSEIRQMYSRTTDEKQRDILRGLMFTFGDYEKMPPPNSTQRFGIYYCGCDWCKFAREHTNPVPQPDAAVNDYWADVEATEDW